MALNHPLSHNNINNPPENYFWIHIFQHIFWLFIDMS